MKRDDFVRAEREARWSVRGLWEIAVNTAVPASEIPSAAVPQSPGRRGIAPLSPLAPARPMTANDVLVTADGRFHRPSCPLGKTGRPVTIEEARARHYLACPKCFVSAKVRA